MHTEEQLQQGIKHIPELSTDELYHNYKCVLSKQSPKEKKFYKPFLVALEKEIKKRGKE